MGHAALFAVLSHWIAIELIGTFMPLLMHVITVRSLMLPSS